MVHTTKPNSGNNPQHLVRVVSSLMKKGNLRPATLLGSLDHPVGQAEMRFENSAIAWKRIWKENDEWCGEVDILNTPCW